MKVLLAEAQPHETGFSPFTWSFKSNLAGFSRLALLASQLGGHVLEDIELSLDGVEWFDANLCAPLGAVLYQAGRGPNSVSVTDVPPRVADILSRNGFLSHYGRLVYCV